MKKNLILVGTFIIIFMFGFQVNLAQVTITIPKLPKIKKPKIEQPTNTDDKQSGEEKSSSDASKDDEMDFRLILFLEKIAKAQKDTDEYTPETKIYLVSSGEYEWLVRAVSPKKRNEFYEKWKSLLTPSGRKKFETAFDALAASAAKKLPLYKANPKVYNFHNPMEEKLMKGTLENIAALKIHKVGLNQANWLIDKNNLGIPTARYKQGMIWLRDPADDHPYCHISYVNIIQDYAGGGTYGASYAKFTGDELAGCP